jgi:protein tyrosine/serine phosphatase
MPMQLTGKSFRNFASAVLVVLALTIVAQAQEATSQNNSNVKIKNFGQMDERFYRGAQPKEEDYKALAALGIKTVIDLQDDPKPYEKSIVESLGMTYVNIPMNDKKYPTEDSTRTFLKLASDPSTGKFFVHCAGGRHRTGAMGAVYRYQLYDWNFDQVYAEMKQFDFYTRWGHGAIKDFVKDYYDKLQIAKSSPASATQSSAAVTH